jgi:hypothetical protein
MSDLEEFTPSSDDDNWLHADGTECVNPGDHKCSAGLVTAEFQRETAEFMARNDELLRRLAQ